MLGHSMAKPRDMEPREEPGQKSRKRKRMMAMGKKQPMAMGKKHQCSYCGQEAAEDESSALVSAVSAFDPGLSATVSVIPSSNFQFEDEEELEPALQESRDTALIEARPSGTIRPGSLKRDLNVIEGTVLITSVSQNGSGKGGRRYSDPALKQIAAMAEGLPAYLNHVPAENAFKPRDVRDLIGVHRNVRYHPHEGKITSDLHVMEHQAPLVFGIAERLGDHVGNSLVSRGLVAMEGDTEVVKEVLAVRSADLVSDPATTKGLFESRAHLDDPFAALISEIRESLTTPKEDSMDLAAILAHLKANPNDQKALCEHFGLVTKADAQAVQESLAAIQGQVKSLTEEKAKAEASVKEAQSKIDIFEAKEALAVKRSKVETALAEHDLGKKYGKDSKIVSDLFKQDLVEAAEDKWKAMLDDRFTAISAVPAARNESPRSALKPESLTEGKEQVNGTRAEAMKANPHAFLAEAITIN